MPDGQEVGVVDRSAAERTARTARALTDPTRMQILSLIVSSPDGRALVGQLADRLLLRQPTVSHHVRVMVDEGVLDRHKEGRVVWYSVRPDRLPQVLDLLHGAAPAGNDESVLDRIADDLALRFEGVFSPETVSRYVRESYELLASEAGITKYLPSLTGRFAAERLRALARAERDEDAGVPEVLFVCVQNAGRSQIASAILRFLAGDGVEVRTAGSAPAADVNPTIVRVLDEIGVPLAGEFPKPLTDEVVRASDYVITMGCGDACPVYPGKTYLDWDLPDPVGKGIDEVRLIRDDISIRVRALLAEMGFPSRVNAR
ncbi:metalloregulator ArsR/SmtB family transcription factor [Naasia sp. SYSU D00057]|uniref:metalloregulator ArsR/SmtB family transcription factor n=1 Tax=Naasia sp. SYSU D00057 TaxID=2817380 RepID=UPI001B31346D|nr:metalloregulator ArsR/SmtB family transcription factor [Naasia sp. SYSU D00057]